MQIKRRRRGISYILEVVMMTLVIVALASVVLAWGLGTITSSRDALTSAVNSRTDRLQEGVLIEDVQMVSPTQLEVWIRNTGGIQVVVDQVYVQNIQSSIVQFCSLQLSVTPPTCTPVSGNKLSLSVQAVGAVWVNVPATVVVTADSGTASGTTPSTLTDSSKTWTLNQWAPPAGQGVFSLLVGGTQYTITSSTAAPPTVTVSPATLPAGTPTYQITCTQVCHGATYVVLASTTRGTTSQGAFTE